MKRFQDNKLNGTKIKLISAFSLFETYIDKHLIKSTEGFKKLEDVNEKMQDYLNTEFSKSFGGMLSEVETVQAIVSKELKE